MTAISIEDALTCTGISNKTPLLSIHNEIFSDVSKTVATFKLLGCLYSDYYSHTFEIVTSIWSYTNELEHFKHLLKCFYELKFRHENIWPVFPLFKILKCQILFGDFQYFCFIQISSAMLICIKKLRFITDILCYTEVFLCVR